MLGRFLFGRKLGLSCCFLLGLPGSGNSIIWNKVILKAPLHLDWHLQDSFFLQLLLQLAERKRRVLCSFSELEPGQSKQADYNPANIAGLVSMHKHLQDWELHKLQGAVVLQRTAKFLSSWELFRQMDLRQIDSPVDREEEIPDTPDADHEGEKTSIEVHRCLLDGWRWKFFKDPTVPGRILCALQL